MNKTLTGIILGTAVSLGACQPYGHTYKYPHKPSSSAPQQVQPSSQPSTKAEQLYRDVILREGSRAIYRLLEAGINRRNDMQALIDKTDLEIAYSELREKKNIHQNIEKLKRLYKSNEKSLLIEETETIENWFEHIRTGKDPEIKIIIR